MNPPVSRLDLALQYAGQGWHVFPLWWVDSDGVCVCDKREACGRNSGKHPRVSNGFKDATANLEQIQAWWTKWPNAHIGIATGPSDLLVLDVDVSHGKPGLESLEKLQQDHGPLPATMLVRTGSGGLHFYFCRDGEELRSPKLKDAGYPALEVKAVGGYVVAPGSGHASGNLYEVEAHEGVLAPVPDFLRVMTQRKRSRPQQAPAASTRFNGRAPAHRSRQLQDGERNDGLASMGGGMRALDFDAQDICNALLAHNAKYCNPPLDRDEVMKVADSISRYTAKVPFGGGVMIPRKPDPWLCERPVDERIFMYLLRRAAFAPRNGLRLGQVRSSWPEIAEGTEWNENNRREKYKESTVRAASARLENKGYITRVRTSTGSLFTVVNYQQYQGFLLHAG